MFEILELIIVFGPHVEDTRSSRIVLLVTMDLCNFRHLIWAQTIYLHSLNFMRKSAEY